MKNKFLLKKRKRRKQFEINIGIQLLRMICCLLVILTHFYAFYHFKFLLKEHHFYLMSFYFISFYFSYKNLASKNIAKIKERLKRLLVPYIGWPLIFFMKTKLFNNTFEKRKKYNLKNFYYQILFGCGIYGIFWFLFNILFLSLFFTLIIFIFKKNFLYVLLIICISDYYWCYSGIAYNNFFSKFKKVPFNHSIAPIFYNFTIAFSGFYFASINLLNIIYKRRIIYFALSCLFISIFLKYYYSFFKRIHFFYIEIINDIFIFFLFSFFSMIPFDKINNKNIKILLNKLTSYTGGVYYIHVKMGDFLRNYFYINRRNTFKGCLLIYLFSYLICFLGTFILNKSFLKYLFI